MTILHTEQTAPTFERDAPFPSAEKSDPYAEVYVDEAYPMIQQQIAEFAEVQKAAIASGDKAKIGNAMALERYVKMSIQRQLSLGFLNDSIVQAEDLDQQADRYFKESLDRYRAAGPDPRIVKQHYEEHADFIPTPGVNISFEEAAALRADRLMNEAEQPQHISEIPVDSLPTETQAEARKDEKLFLKIVRGLGFRAITGPTHIIIHSGEIVTLKPGDPTRVMPVIEDDTETR